MKRSVNFKFLACLMGVVALSVVGIHFLHGFQVQRNASALLRQAERAEDEGDLDKTINYLHRYLALEPQDDDSLAMYGLALEKRCHKAMSPLELQKRLTDVFFTFENVLRRAPERRDVRRRQVDVAIALKRYSTASDHLKSLLSEPTSSDAALEELLGWCLERDNENAGAAKAKEYAQAAAKAYSRSIKLDPKNLRVYQQLAQLYRERLKEERQAKITIDKMVSANGGQVKALLARAVYWMRYARKDKTALAQVAKDVAKAQEIAGDDGEVIMMAAELARAKHDRDGERRLLTRGIELRPNEAAMYIALIHLEAKDDKPVAALACADRGLKALPRNADLRALKCDLLIQKGDTEAAAKELAKLPKDHPPESVNFLKASLAVAKGNRGEAVPILEDLREKSLSAGTLAVQVNILLGECLEGLGNPDEALLAYKDAVKSDPKSIRARLGLGSALMAMGSYPEAVSEYRQIVELKRNAVGARLVLAQALIFANLNKPRKSRDWSEVKEDLDEAAKEVPDSVDVPIWQAEILSQEGAEQMEQARKLLVESRDRAPDRIEPRIALANLVGRQGKPEEALHILDEAARRPKLAGAIEISLNRVRHLARLNSKPHALKGLAAVKSDLGKYSNQGRLRLSDALGNAYFNLGHTKEAQEVWTRVAQEQPQNLGLRLILFDLAMADGAEAKMRRLVEQIRVIEPKNKGVYWRYTEAALLIFQAEKMPVSKRKSLLEKARNHVPELTKRRPRWFRVAALEGRIDQLEDHLASAIAHYQDAMGLNDRRPEVVRQLVQLLYGARRYAEADHAVRVLIDNEQSEGLLAAGLGKVATMTLLQSDREQAHKVALRSVPEDSENYLDHLWLGQILLGLGKTNDAEKALARARKLAPDRQETWVAYVSFLVHTGRKKEAEDAINEAARRLPKNEVHLALGHCYERAGNVDQAEKHFRDALKVRPNDLQVLQDVASFYLRIDPVKAERHLESMLTHEIAKPDDLIWVRRCLAGLLAGTSNEQRFQRALKLIDENIKVGSGAEKDKDRRVKALLLATRPKHRKEAIRLFEDYRGASRLSGDEQLALANLYEADNNWSKAQLLMFALLGSEEGKNPAYYAYYARRLLEHNQVAEAEKWLEKLEEKQPASLRTKEIKARLLRAQGKHDAAVALLKEYAQSKGARLSVPVLLLDEFSQTGESRELYSAQAEEMYLRYVQEDKQPGRFLAYAGFLGRQQRTREALDRCEEALQKGSPQTVLAIAVEVLRDGKAGPDQQGRVERWLAQALANAPQSVPLQLALGNFHDFRGRYPEAIATYEQILRDNRNSLLARNNLAWLLALHAGKGSQALERIQEAIELGGESPELLDTRAVIYLALGQIDKAITDLDSSLMQVSGPSTSTANRKFHLARAYWSRNDKPNARRAFAEARSAGLQETSLHPLELPAFQRLVKELN